MIEMHHIEIKAPMRAIVCFGPMTDMTGMSPGAFYQVTIDPDMASPGGDYIRFDARHVTLPDEIHGWQRISALTICEVLIEGEAQSNIKPIIMRAVVKE